MYTQINKRDMFVGMFAVMIAGGLLYNGVTLMFFKKELTAKTMFSR